MAILKKAYYYFEEWLIDLFENRIGLIAVLIFIACILQIKNVEIKFINGDVFSEDGWITNAFASKTLFYIALGEVIGLYYFLGKIYKMIRRK